MTMIGMYHQDTGNVAIASEMAFKHVHSKNGWTKPDESIPGDKLAELAGHLGINLQLGTPDDVILEFVLQRSGSYETEEEEAARNAELLSALRAERGANGEASPAAQPLTDQQVGDQEVVVDTVNVDVNANQANLEFPDGATTEAAPAEEPKTSKSKNKNA